MTVSMKPSKLADSRRFVNTTKLVQSVHNRPQNEFVRTPVGGCVQGAQFAEVCKAPTFKEVLYHLGSDELYDLIQKENDVDLLEHLQAVEQYSDDPRKAVVSMFKARIKAIQSGPEKKPAQTQPEGGQGTDGSQHNVSK